MSCNTKTESGASSQQSESRGAKYDTGKPKLSLISPDMWAELLADEAQELRQFVVHVANAAHSRNFEVLRTNIEVAILFAKGCIGKEHCIRFCCMGLEYGLVKYTRNNWKQGFEWSRLLDAALRHVVLGVAMGEDIDKESGNPHWGHALCMLMFLLHCIEEYPELNDIY